MLPAKRVHQKRHVWIGVFSVGAFQGMLRGMFRVCFVRFQIHARVMSPGMSMTV